MQEEENLIENQWCENNPINYNNLVKSVSYLVLLSLISKQIGGGSGSQMWDKLQIAKLLKLQGVPKKTKTIEIT